MHASVRLDHTLTEKTTQIYPAFEVQEPGQQIYAINQYPWPSLKVQHVRTVKVLKSLRIAPMTHSFWSQLHLHNVSRIDSVPLRVTTEGSSVYSSQTISQNLEPHIERHRSF